MRRMLCVAIALSCGGPARAWTHTGVAWVEAEDFPLPYRTSDGGVGDCLVGAPGGQCAAAAVDAFDAWSAETCTAFGGQDEGFTTVTGLVGDGQNGIGFGTAPLEPGVLGTTLVDRSGIAFIRDGQLYDHATEFEVWLAEDGGWVTQAEADAGTCDGGVTVRYVLAHEIGHVAGLGHSCEQGDPCGDPDLAGALMYWSAAACESDYSPRPDDVAGLEALYGPAGQFACGIDGADVQIGVVPMTLNCAATAEVPLDSASWSFGDGEMEEGLAPTHTWREEGLYTVRVTLRGQDPDCGPFETTVERRGYVRVCDEPRAAFRMEHIQGLSYRVINTTPIDVVGCITAVQWSIHAGRDTSGEPEEVRTSWDFDYTFPHEGEWTVVLNVGGPAGTRAAEVGLDVVARAGVGPFGCDQGGGGPGIGLLLVALLGLARRR